MKLEPMTFRAFLSEFAIPVDMAAKIFSVSRRTVQRWAQSDRIPGPAAQMVMTIRVGSVPWSASGWRGLRAVVGSISWEWRELLFAPPGGRWQDFRTDAERERAREAAERAQAIRKADALRRYQVRLKAARKAAATRAANRAARLAKVVSLRRAAGNPIPAPPIAVGASRRAAGFAARRAPAAPDRRTARA